MEGIHAQTYASRDPLVSLKLGLWILGGEGGFGHRHLPFKRLNLGPIQVALGDLAPALPQLGGYAQPESSAC